MPSPPTCSACRRCPYPFSGHRVAEFARRCGMMWSGVHRGSGGTTILTSLRVDVGRVRHERLRVPRLQRERGYALASAALPAHTAVDVVSVHLSLDADERAWASAPGSAPAPDRRLVVAGYSSTRGGRPAVLARRDVRGR